MGLRASRLFTQDASPLRKGHSVAKVAYRSTGAVYCVSGSVHVGSSVSTEPRLKEYVLDSVSLSLALL